MSSRVLRHFACVCVFWEGSSQIKRQLSLLSDDSAMLCIDMVDRVFRYAEKVASGFRQPLPDDWPLKVQRLFPLCCVCHSSLLNSALAAAVHASVCDCHRHKHCVTYLGGGFAAARCER